MKDLVLVDPRVQRARLFREAIQVYRRRLPVLRDRSQQLVAKAEEERAKARQVLQAMNCVAARRYENLNGDEVRLQVFETFAPAIDYLKELDGHRSAVVFTDVYLRGSAGAFSGIDLVSTIKGDPRLRRIPTVLLATDAPPERVREAWQAGSSAVVHLPVELPGMLLRVTDAVEFWFRTAAL
jgi:CheY-like chemotaxis protein